MHLLEEDLRHDAIGRQEDAKPEAEAAQITEAYAGRLEAIAGGGRSISSGAGFKKAVSLSTVREARTKGYEGDPCPACQQFTLVRNGACLKCVSCGATRLQLRESRQLIGNINKKAGLCRTGLFVYLRCFRKKRNEVVGRVFDLQKPSVYFKALSIVFIGSLPITRSMAISVMVARLSVITTESVSNPEFFPSDDSNFTSTRLECLARNVLLVIIATMTCGKSVPNSSA